MHGTDDPKENTRHIISKAEFAKMKDGVVVVNTARGAVMDEAALVESLDSGKVFSAGLDVFEEEPTIHPGLLSNQNVMLVPHMGTWTSEVRFECLCDIVIKLTMLDYPRYGRVDY